MIGNQTWLHAVHQSRDSLTIVPVSGEVRDSSVWDDGLNPSQEGFLGTATIRLPFALITYPQLIAEDESPYETENKLLVVAHEIRCT